MDTLRGHDVANDQDDFDSGDDAAIETPPAVGSDERRMQVRAYNSVSYTHLTLPTIYSV